MIIPENTILWDWNGTLLDDARICMETMNTMLKRRGMTLLDMDIYRDVFGFPVLDYYRRIGFDVNRESFEDLSAEFISGYDQVLVSAPLARNAREVLEYFRAEGRKNVIVSAMRQDMLLKSVKDKGLFTCFDEILGIDDIYAAGKLELALQYVRRNKPAVPGTVFIGDTEHDFEVARGIGCRCILIADGHQSEDRLRATGAEVFPSLGALVNGRLRQ